MTRHRLFHGLLASGLLVLSAFVSSDIAFAEVWSSVLPAEAKGEGDFRLCESDHTGQSELYSCRDYLSPQGRYRFLYRGGPYPKAVAITEHGSSETHSHRMDRLGTSYREFKIEPPEGVPESATHLGTGVCEDEDGNPVPCSVFRHAPARDPSIHHYMVFYDTHGHGPSEIEKQRMGANPYAMVAELAHQMGLNLLRAECCHRLAGAYFAHAYELFPDDDDYRGDYLRHQTVAAQLDCTGSSPEIIGSR